MDQIIDFTRYTEVEGFGKYLKEYLPKEVDFFCTFDLDKEIEYLSKPRLMVDGAYIEIGLPCGKGYSSHYRRRCYTFEKKDGHYRCEEKLYDSNREAQLMRKIARAFEEFLGEDKCPQLLIMSVDQELD